MANDITVTFLGTRGSIPVCGEDFLKYGGDTSCVYVDTGKEAIILDSGTGIMRMPETSPGLPMTILLSHAHIDHILGLPAFQPLYANGRRIDIFAEPRGGLSAMGQVSTLMRLPLWPVTPNSFGDGVKFRDIRTPEFEIGSIGVETMQAIHPGGCTVFKLTIGGSILVYCTDFEHSPEYSDQLAKLAEGCSLLIYDAQYSEEEYKTKHKWGHSTWDQGVIMGERCGAKRVALFHHNPPNTDDVLDAAQEYVSAKSQKCYFAKSGEVITI